MSAVLSTYRLQLRAPDFTFAEAEALLDYLDELGITHLYLSPILTALPGSAHGYDITDPTTISAERGGAAGLARLSAAARSRGMGLIVDIVPNHVGVAVPAQNRWWWDVLRHGRDSAYARFFDIDWDLEHGRLLLPVLDDDEDLAGLSVHGDTLRLGELVLPIAPGTADGIPGHSDQADAVYARQHYQLVSWRDAVCGYRRFLTVNSLAALRQDDDHVFAATHAEIARWFTDGLVDGVRVDHLDGLADPAGYLRALRALTGRHAWIIVEKNLATAEALEPSLPVQGTTGYDMLRLIGGIFVDPGGAATLTALAEPVESAVELTTSAAAALTTEMGRLCRSVEAHTGSHDRLLAPAIAALVGHLGVYRCDYPVTEPMLRTAIAVTIATAPEFGAALAQLSAAVTDGDEAAVRLQQVCVTAFAGGIEGRLFHRSARLVSLNEFGGDPTRFGCSTAEFHLTLAQRAQHWPHAMTTLSTHDTLRSEDVRARIGVLSQLSGRWADAVQRWQNITACPDLATGLLLWQNIFGVWPTDGVVTESLRSRLHSYARKVIREAGRHTSWQHPDTFFEAAVSRWLHTVFDTPIAAELTSLVQELQPHADNDALAQKLLALTVPGVPDVYQGTEVFDDSLNDPDNRRPVDFGARRAALSALQHPKIRIVQAALRLRRDYPDLFSSGDYHPMLACGPAAEHVVAFRRGGEVVVAVARFTVRLAETGWGDTALTMPAGVWTDRLTGRRFSGAPGAEQLFSELPGVLLERDRR